MGGKTHSSSQRKKKKEKQTTHKVWKDKHEGTDSSYRRELEFLLFPGRRPGNTVKFQRVLSLEEEFPNFSGNTSWQRNTAALTIPAPYPPPPPPQSGLAGGGGPAAEAAPAPLQVRSACMDSRELSGKGRKRVKAVAEAALVCESVCRGRGLKRARPALLHLRGHAPTRTRALGQRRPACDVRPSARSQELPARARGEASAVALTVRILFQF